MEAEVLLDLEGVLLARGEEGAPLLFEVSYEVSVPGGALLLELGPLVELWSSSSTGIARPASATVAHPGLTLGLGYALALGRHVALLAALSVEAMLVQEDFSVGGAGVLASTPRWWLCPSLGVALR